MIVDGKMIPSREQMQSVILCRMVQEGDAWRWELRDCEIKRESLIC